MLASFSSTSQLKWSSYDDGGRTVSCPGELITLTCTVKGVNHFWMIRSENIMEDVHIRTLTLNLYPHHYSRIGWIRGQC